jgi:hypothetical protein
MEWLILAVLLPAILIPIVLLFGFCGCGSFEGDSDTSVSAPPAPTNLRAVLAFTKDGFVLTWSNFDAVATDPDITGSQIERQIDPPPPGVKPALLDNDNSAAIYLDTVAMMTGLAEGTTYVYRVRSRSPNGLSDPSNEARSTLPPNPPTNLAAAGVDLDQINLTWKNGSAHATRFRIMHRVPGGTFTDLDNNVTGLTYQHKGLAENSTHEYQISALVDGYDDSMAKPVESTFSATAVGKTLAWKTAYFQPLNPAVSLAYAGYCVVQRIDAAHLMQSGQFVRVTLRALATADTSLTAVTLSNAVPVTAAQGWDSAGPPMILTFAGSPSVLIKTGLTATSDKIKFKITAGAGQDLVVALNVAAAPASQNIRAAVVTGPRNYYKAAAAEATANPRSAGYKTFLNQVCCIEKIEVA